MCYSEVYQYCVVIILIVVYFESMETVTPCGCIEMLMLIPEWLLLIGFNSSVSDVTHSVPLALNKHTEIPMSGTLIYLCTCRSVYDFCRSVSMFLKTPVLSFCVALHRRYFFKGHLIL